MALSACTQKNTSTMSDKTENDETVILATVRQLAELMIKRDTVSMSKILDKEYTLTHMTGYVQPRTEWFGEVEKESMKYYSAKEISHTINITGDKANVTVRNLVDARIWGSRNTWPLQQKMQLEKRNGKWIILHSIASTY
jgi:hypothetical protein